MSDDKKATVHLSLAERDKRDLKIMAAERGMTASALVHGWIERERSDGDNGRDERGGCEHGER